MVFNSVLVVGRRKLAFGIICGGRCSIDCEIRSMIRIIFIVVLLFSCSARAEEVIAVVDLKFLRETGEVASTLCFDDGSEEQNCATWATFYLFEARVKKVVFGELKARKFHVWLGVHALKKGNIKNMVAKLMPLPPEHEAAYQIIGWGDKRELYCFEAKQGEAYNTSIKLEGENVQCYEYDIE